jgi:hypothetical protein
VLANFTDEPAEIPADGSWQVLVSTDRRHEGGAFGGTLAGTTAVVLTPAN